MAKVDELRPIIPKGKANPSVYSERITVFVVLACVNAASGGLMFGYVLGVSGGVTAMDDFLLRFFPDVYRQREVAETNNYCTFNSQVLTLFTSLVYIAGLIASFFASIVTRRCGRKSSMLLGGASFLTGSALNGFAENLAMLIVGRILLGVGVGFTTQSVPLYLSEMAPPHLRGALSMMFQVAISSGALIANLINVAANEATAWGWRLSLGFGAVPSTIMLLGSFILPDTPCSLIERGHTAKGHAVLQSIRGTTDVEKELNDLLKASEISKNTKHPWRKILKRKYRPQLVMAFAIPFFQQMSGIDVITFFAPLLFETIGFGTDSSLYCTVLIDAMALLATLTSASVVDRFGRRKLLLQGGCLMIASQVTLGSLLAWKLGPHTVPSLGEAWAVVGLICLYELAFQFSWGPLGWVIPSEIFPMEVRPVGMSIGASVILLLAFTIAELFLSMLCYLQWGTFFFFAAWGMVMTVFVWLLLPETKNVALEDTPRLWQRHPIWSYMYRRLPLAPPLLS